MAGVSTTAMATAMSEDGGLGSLGLGASSPEAAREAISDTSALTARSFNLNVFCHAPAERDDEVEQSWIEHSRPRLAESLIPDEITWGACQSALDADHVSAMCGFY